MIQLVAQVGQMISRHLAATDIRDLIPNPRQSTIGLELTNSFAQWLSLPVLMICSMQRPQLHRGVVGYGNAVGLTSGLCHF